LEEETKKPPVHLFAFRALREERELSRLFFAKNAFPLVKHTRVASKKKKKIVVSPRIAFTNP
jgi:hypothetical protein